MKFFKYPILILTIFILFNGENSANDSSKWKYWKTKDNIKLYKRSFNNSGIIEVKAETIINAAPEVIEAVLRDIPAYKDFMYSCMEGRLIKEYDDENMIILNVTKMPWPLSPRDVVVKSRVKKDFENGKFEVALVGLKKGESEKWVPLIKNHERMYELTGTFRSSLLSRTKTSMTYIVHADPKGIPSIIVNMFVDDNPVGTLQGLKKMVKKQKYIDAGKNSKYLKQIEDFFSKKEKTASGR